MAVLTPVVCGYVSYWLPIWGGTNFLKLLRTGLTNPERRTDSVPLAQAAEAVDAKT
jgi:hypothetical protein